MGRSLGPVPPTPSRSRRASSNGGCRFQGVRDRGGWVLRARGGSGIDGEAASKAGCLQAQDPSKAWVPPQGFRSELPQGRTAEKRTFLFHVCPSQAPGKPGAHESLGDLGQRLPGSPPTAISRTRRRLRRPDLTPGAPRRGGRARRESCRSCWFWCLLTWGSGHKVALGRGSVLCGHVEVSRLLLKNCDTIKYGSPKGDPASTSGAPADTPVTQGTPSFCPLSKQPTSEGIRAPRLVRRMVLLVCAGLSHPALCIPGGRALSLPHSLCGGALRGSGRPAGAPNPPRKAHPHSLSAGHRPADPGKVMARWSAPA